MGELTRMITRINIEMSGDIKKYAISAKQGDKATRYVIVNLLNGGKEYVIPEGAKVNINVKKPDGKRVYNPCSYFDSEVTVELTNQMLAASGTAYCDIEIRTSDESQIITSASFTIEIEEKIRSDDALLSSNEFSVLEEKVKNINDVEEAIKKAGQEVSQAKEEVQQSKQEIIDETYAKLEMDIAAKAGLKPEFANSVEECTDTSKMYVLPDGFIYAYMYSDSEQYTNVVPASENKDGGVFNDVGYMNGNYISDNAEQVDTNFVATGFIPYNMIDGAFPTIYVKGLSWVNESHSRLYLYNEQHATIYGTGQVLNMLGANSNLELNFTIEKLGESYWKLTPANALYSNVGNNAVAYMRMSLKGKGENLIITFDEPIETAKTYRWENTSHAFVPANYEDRILNTEENVKKLTERLDDIDKTDVDNAIESYVQIEAERVAKEVYSKQNANTFSFLAFSDAHYLADNSNIVNSIIHAGQGMNLVRKRVHIDFGVVLGDNGWGSGIRGDANRATIDKGIDEIRATNKCIDDAFRDIPNLRTTGNHDCLIYNYSFNNNNWLDGNKLFPLYGAYNTDAVYPKNEKDRGYCYRDFDEWKLRVICMNTVDLKDLTVSDNLESCYVSGTQQKWLAETIDLSEKEDASEWSILILSHHPLDFGMSIRVCNILKAYTDGKSVSQTYDNVTIEYDYAEKNRAIIVGNIHGHNHNYLVDNLRYLVGGSTTAPLNVKRLCIPNACFSRNNERGQNNGTDAFDIEFGEEITYSKKANTAEDTAFCVITIDTVKRKLYATHYGAGIDREVSY